MQAQTQVPTRDFDGRYGLFKRATAPPRVEHMDMGSTHTVAHNGYWPVEPAHGPLPLACLAVRSAAQAPAAVKATILKVAFVDAASSLQLPMAVI